MSTIPETGAIKFSEIGSVFGIRPDEESAVYLLDYLPGGQLSSNINFSTEDENADPGTLKLATFRAKAPMAITGITHDTLSATSVRVAWTGDYYTHARVAWPGGYQDVPYGTFEYIVNSMTPGSGNSITVTPVTAAARAGKVADTTVVTAPPLLGSTGSVASSVLTYDLTTLFPNATSYHIINDPYSAATISGTTLFVQPRNRNTTHNIAVSASNAYTGAHWDTVTVQESADPALSGKVFSAYSIKFYSGQNTWKPDHDYDKLLATYGLFVYVPFYGTGIISPDVTETMYQCRLRFNGAENSLIRNTTIEYTRNNGTTWDPIPENNVPSGLPLMTRSGETYNFAVPYTIYIEANEYPPPAGVPTGDQWTKDAGDTLLGLNNVTYRKYKTTVSGQSYGNGTYTAWANTIYSYLDGDTYSGGEWPPSGLFDKQGAATNARTGWHTSTLDYTLTNSSDTPNPLIVGIDLPAQIYLRQYKLQPRTDGALQQMPSKWTLEGSSDGSTWTFIDSRSGESSWVLGTDITYSIPVTTVAYSRYRLIIYRNNSATPTATHIGEWKLYG